MTAQQDDISELLMIGSYGGGRTTTGPDEVLTRKIRASQSTPVGTSVFSTLNFRILGSSGAGRNLMRSRVKLCMPLEFDEFTFTQVGNGADGGNKDIRAGAYAAIGPRRSGVLQSFRQISTVVNNSASFSVQVGETLAQLDDQFLPANACGEGRRDGGGYTAVAEPIPGADGRVSFREVNAGFAERRQNWLDGNGLAGVAGNGESVVTLFETELPITPFRRWTYPPSLSANTHMLAHIDSIDVNFVFRENSTGVGNANTLSRYFLESVRRAGAVTDGSEETRICTGARVRWAGNPYLSVSMCTSPFRIPPAITIPAVRQTQFTVNVPFTGGAQESTISLQQVRLESWPDVMWIYCTQRDEDRQGADLAWVDWWPRCKPDSFRMSVGERASLLNDLSEREWYSYYKRNAGSICDVSFNAWRKKRQVLCITNDMFGGVSKNVFNPATYSFDMTWIRPAQVTAQNANMTCKFVCWYFSESLSISAQAAAQTSMLVNQSSIKGPSGAAQAVQMSLQALSYE